MSEFIENGRELAKHPYEEMRELCAKCELDPTKDYGRPNYVFEQCGIGFAPTGDIQMIKAPQKNGKTFLFALMMGAILRGEYLGLTCRLEHPCVLYIDTEQHPRNTQLVYRRVCKIAGISGRERHVNFKSYHFRGKSPEEIRKSLLFLLGEYKPNVIFLDGVRDLVEDFNDQKESKEMVTMLMDKALEYDCSIWSILHVNPGSDKARGHLGTEMQNKVSDVLTCLKEKTEAGTIFTVDQTDARNRDIQKFSFEIQDVPEGSGTIAIPVNTHISVKTKVTADETMAKALADGPLRYNDLVDRIVEVAEVSIPTAKRRIKEAREAGIIEQDPVMGKIRYKGLDSENEEGLPF